MSEIDFNVKKIIKNDLVFLIFLLVVTTIAYATNWWGDFLSDDIAGIANNPNLSNLGMMIKTLSPVNVTYSIIYKVFGPVPFWFHLVNTFLHLGTIIVVYCLVYILTKNKFITQVASVLFALHPIITESVTWISALPYVMYTFFFFSSLLIFILVDKNILKFKWVYGSACLYIVAMFASEKATFLPAIFFFYLLLYSKISWQKIKLLIPGIIAMLLYSLKVFTSIGPRVESLASDPSSAYLHVFNPFKSIPFALFTYFKLFIYPLNQTFYHEGFVFSQVEYAIALIYVISIFAFIFVFFKKYKIAAFGLLLFLIALSPTLLPFGLGWIVAERYISAASLGFFIFFAWLIYLIKKHFNGKKNFENAVIIMLVLILMPLTIKRNLEWKNQDTLWIATLKTSPNSAYVHNNMGDYYMRHGDMKSAAQSFENARRLRPKYAEATHNLALVYYQLGDEEKAIKYFKEALSYSPKVYQTAERLGQIYFSHKDYETSEQYILHAIQYNPDPFMDYTYLYTIYKAKGDEQKAQEALKKAEQISDGSKEKEQIIKNLLNNNAF